MITIKRYNNRKLYDVAAKKYVTLEDIGKMVRLGEELKIVDHASGSDLTTLTLLQVVLEEEKRIGGLLPQVMLTRLIKSSGSTFSGMRNALQAVMDLDQFFIHTLHQKLERFEEDGRITADERQKIITLFDAPIEASPPEAVEVETAAEGEVDAADLQSLMDQVQQLEAELEKLKQANAGS